jgi:putative DNA primase/helicase
MASIGNFFTDQQPEPEWEDPVSLRSAESAADYPIGDLPDIIRDAVEEVAEGTQAPISMIAASALSVVSSCVQGLASVQRDESLRGPASLFLLSLADSGERKSTVDGYFTKALREWEATQKEKFDPIYAEYLAEEKAWEATDAGYRDAMRKAAREGSDITKDKNYMAHALSKPKPPRRPQMLRMDDTPEAIAVALSRWPIASIISAEAGVIFGAHGMNPDSVMRNLSQMNVFWDGGHIKRDRTTQQSVDIEGMRVTAGLQVQPKVLENFMGKSGELARGVGYFARFLFSQPDSTQGTRFYKEPKPGMPALEAFTARVRYLLSIPVNVDEDGRLHTCDLTLDPEAKKMWVDFYNSVEDELDSRGYHYDISDVANKAADNAARMAACFHAFTLTDGFAIPVDHMVRATSIMPYYLHEALRFAKLTKVPAAVRNAQALEAWFKEQYWTVNGYGEVAPQFGYYLRTADISQRGPDCVRAQGARDAALDILETHHRFKVVKYGKKKIVFANPVLLSEWARDL